MKLLAGLGPHLEALGKKLLPGAFKLLTEPSFLNYRSEVPIPLLSVSDSAPRDSPIAPDVTLHLKHSNVLSSPSQDSAL